MRNTAEREEEKKKEIADSFEVAARGKRTERFLLSEFWLLDLEPVMAKIQHDAKGQIGWTPASEKTLELYALTSAYYSAVDQTVYEMLQKINAMILAGQEAEAYLEKTK